MGTTDNKTFAADKTTPFWDASLPAEERIAWLLSHMTIEEKLRSMPSFSLDLERLGIPAMGAGGEAAHGVEGRNDQNGLGIPDISTSFPQPIGMSATWDTDLIKQAGSVTGKEARVIYHRHPRFGLSRWAPTVDLERDPRWGRNEEGYGEDPYLTGEMASAYIQGMQGDDPHFLQCAATLKHFYANNTEKRRCFVNTTVDPRNKYEYYMDVFRRCIEKGHVEGIMTAYNGINGIPGILNPEVKDVLKGKYGLTHAVSDGSATVLVVKQHHYFGIHAETIAAALKAGIDAFSDKPDNVNKAVQDAYDLHLIDESDLDLALTNMLKTKLKLGIYDAVQTNPYDFVTEKDLCSAENTAISLKMAEESVVLLKNQDNMLPMAKNTLADTALIGPVTDTWYMDWYGGRSAYKKTLKQGMEDITGNVYPETDGRNRVIFRLAGAGKQGIAAAEDNSLIISENPDVFIVEDWGEDSYNFRCERTGKYMNCTHPDAGCNEEKGIPMACEKEETFDWFVLELFHVLKEAGGTVQLTNRFDFPMQVNEEQKIVYMCDSLEEAHFVMEVVTDGIKEAAELAAKKETVVLALGCNPMINAKEEIDRKTIELPPAQKALFDAVYAVNQNIVLVLLCNYPYALGDIASKAKAILWSATGGQDMGTAVAKTLVGENAPAGRLNQTWYLSDDDLWPIEDYDIIRHPRTYRYFEGNVLYPFGYGLTYTNFEYTDLIIEQNECTKIKITFNLSNIGGTVSDEVVQIYGSFPSSNVKRPIKQLLAFKRVKNIAPGETRKIELEVMTDDLRFYDVKSKTMILEEGEYTFSVGPNSARTALSGQLFLVGTHPGTRDLAKKNEIDHFDNYENIELTTGHFQFTAAQVAEGKEKAVMIYENCIIPEGASNMVIHMRSEKGCKVNVLINEVPVGSYSGDTIHYEVAKPFLMGNRAKDDFAYQEAHRSVQYTDVVIPIEAAMPEEESVLTITIEGDARLCYYYMN